MNRGLLFTELIERMVYRSAEQYICLSIYEKWGNVDLNIRWQLESPATTRFFFFFLGGEIYATSRLHSANA